MNLMDEEESAEVQELMTTDLIVCHTDATVAEVTEALQAEAEDAEILELFVTDADNRLTGIVSLHRLVTARPETAMAHLMDREFVTVTARTRIRKRSLVFSLGTTC